jgi:serine protease Do
MQTSEQDTELPLTPSHTPTRPVYRRPAAGFAFAIFFLIITLLISVVGGMAGFDLLANSTSPSLVSLRHKLGLDGTGSVGIPVHESIRLDESSAVIDASKKVSPAVVSITASQQVSDFFGNVTSQEVSGGSGFIMTSDGLIVTNKHVVADTTVTYKVILADGRIFDATVKARDPLADFAVVQINAKDLPTVELGDSDSVQVGQSVIAVGNALGEFQNSVTLGVISGKQRSISPQDEGTGASEQLTGLFQTDAAINPGNSGGPLVNLAGQVVGINTAIASTTGGSIGLGFAIPINSLKPAIDSVRKTGEIIRPKLGVSYRQIDAAYQQANKLSVDYGALVIGSSTQAAVTPGSPAEKAGIKSGDILLELNGERITDDSPLTDLLAKYNVGDKVTIKLTRDGKEQTVTATLDKW